MEHGKGVGGRETKVASSSRTSTTCLPPNPTVITSQLTAYFSTSAFLFDETETFSKRSKSNKSGPSHLGDTKGDAGDDTTPPELTTTSQGLHTSNSEHSVSTRDEFSMASALCTRISSNRRVSRCKRVESRLDSEESTSLSDMTRYAYR